MEHELNEELKDRTRHVNVSNGTYRALLGGRGSL